MYLCKTIKKGSPPHGIEKKLKKVYWYPTLFRKFEWL